MLSDSESISLLQVRAKDVVACPPLLFYGLLLLSLLIDLPFSLRGRLDYSRWGLLLVCIRLGRFLVTLLTVSGAFQRMRWYALPGTKTFA